MLTDNIRIAKKRVDLILREAPFIGIIRIRFTGYDLSRVSPGTPASTAKLLKKTKSTK